MGQILKPMLIKRAAVNGTGGKPLLKQSYCTGECFRCHSLQVLIPGDSHLLATSGTSAFKMSFAVSWQPPKKSVFLCTEAPVVTLCCFSGIITTPSPTLSAISLNLVFQRTSLRAGDPTLILAKFKPVSHFGKGQGSRLYIKNISTCSIGLKPLENALLGNLFSI